MNMYRDFKGVWIPKEIWLDKELGWAAKLLLVEIDSLQTNGECFATNEYFSKFLGLSKRRITKLISELSSKGCIDVEMVYKEGSKQVEKRVITTRGYRERARVKRVASQAIPEVIPMVETTDSGSMDTNFGRGGIAKNYVEPMEQKCHIPMEQKFRGGIEQKFQGGMEQKFRDINTSIINTCIKREKNIIKKERQKTDKEAAPKSSENQLQTKRKKFIPPTVEEVREYCRARRNNISAEMFIASYEAKGWFIGKNKMKDWRAAVRTWELRAKSERTNRANDYLNGEESISAYEEATSGISYGEYLDRAYLDMTERARKSESRGWGL